MATASPVQLTTLSARPDPQFNHFRGGTNTNANSSSSNATTGNAHNYSTTSNTASSIKPQELVQMAQIARPSSASKAERIPPVVASRAVIGSNHVPNNSPGVNQQELVELSSNALIEGVLGPNRDGRVRNPVPSKLKGKTDNKQGNFGVMHMGASPGRKAEAQGRDSAAERDAAARRTSENTASRAKAAQQEKYIPPKKRGLEAGHEMGNRGSPFAVSKNDDRSRARPLAPDETKFEQARLLTLLRSINPVTVVDQICKAIAYFGGIPGAPPPEDGIFPESANTRETGALFIGWVAEIFPDVASRSPEVPVKEAQGSAKKKSRPSTTKKGAEKCEAEPPNSRNGYGFGPAVAAPPAWGLPQPTDLVVNPPIPSTLIAEGAPGANMGQDLPSNSVSSAAGPNPGTPAHAQNHGVDNDASNKKRRGRPKGSTNKRGKDGIDGDSTSKDADSTLNDSMIDPQLQSTAQLEANPLAISYAAGYPNPIHQSDSQKPVQPYQYPLQTWSNQQKNQNLEVVSQADELSPQERAILEAFRHQGVEPSNSAAPAPVAPMAGTPQAANDTGGAKKRKRGPTKPKANATNATPQVPNSDSTATMSLKQLPHASGSIPDGSAVPLPQVPDASQWTSTNTTTPILPPAKKVRVRKPKAPAAPKEPPARTQTASAVSASTPTITPSTINETQVAAPQPTLSVSRPPAEGLEAHYERFASLQQQGGRSNTPTHPQHQRQQSKPGSVPPQQTTPQMQNQQVQMQQQKSQQGILAVAPQDESKKSQTASNTRPGSTNFYNQQRNQSASYGQQYPSQASQLYAGHQASPQLSNANTLNNTNTINSTSTIGNTTSIPNGNALSSASTSSNHTYGRYSSNPLSQGSPQFPQHDTTYRTASPHTISQPATSYTNTDNNFRTNSHSLTQPTSSYPQSDNTYRAPTTNTHTQPSTSYSSARTHSQPTTSHQHQYNHFSDSSFLDLPTLDSLGHNGNSSTTPSVGMGVAGYGQGLNLGQSSSRSGTTSNLYGSSSGLSHTYDNSQSDLLRGVGRSSSNTNPGGYGTGSSDMGYFHKRT